MGKLHELLAVESSLKSKATSELSKVKHLFAQGEKNLIGQVRTYQPLEEGGEDFADEITNLATTVGDELDRVELAFGQWLQVAINKEITNVQTQADVEIDDRVILRGLPAPALLNLESKLGELRTLYDAIPINNPTERWTWDGQEGHWVSAERTTYKTKKLPKSFIAHEATPDHPAQVQVFTEDQRVGIWTTTIHSGLISPTQKRAILNRIDKLTRAVKRARQRANDIEATNIDVYSAIFDYIHGRE